MIEFKQVVKKYHNQKVLKDLTLTIESGELFVLVGPSGSGKTTLLKTINRLVIPTSGAVLIDGEDVACADLQRLRQNIGYVLQTGALFPNMTVGQNAAIQLEALGWAKGEQKVRVAQLLNRVGLPAESFMARMPNELSGGEAQRVGIVRALAASPKLVLMDEPFSALDPVSRRQLQDLIVTLHREFETTIVFVTHDMHEATLLADRLAVIYNGVLQQVGRPKEVMANPVNPFVRQFFDAESSGNRLLKQVILAGFGRKKRTTDAVRSVSGSDTIFEWAHLLEDNFEQLIEVDGHVLTLQDLLSYLGGLGEVGWHVK